MQVSSKLRLKLRFDRLYDMVSLWSPAHDIQNYHQEDDLARRATHREAVFQMVFYRIFDAWHYKALWTYAWMRTV
jgi:hypothetical protein